MCSWMRAARHSDRGWRSRGVIAVFTCRSLIIITPLALAVFGCGRGAMPAPVPVEPPPPQIEPDLLPGARLVEPRADQLIRQMSDRLAGATALALEAEEVYDEVPTDTPRQQL